MNLEQTQSWATFCISTYPIMSYIPISTYPISWSSSRVAVAVGAEKRTCRSIDEQEKVTIEAQWRNNRWLTFCLTSAGVFPPANGDSMVDDSSSATTTAGSVTMTTHVTMTTNKQTAQRKANETVFAKQYVTYKFSGYDSGETFKGKIIKMMLKWYEIYQNHRINMQVHAQHVKTKWILAKIEPIKYNSTLHYNSLHTAD